MGVARGGVSTPPPARGWVEILALFRVSLRPSEGGKYKNFAPSGEFLEKSSKISLCRRARAKNSSFFKVYVSNLWISAKYV